MKFREVIPLKQRPYFQINLPGSKSITNRMFLCAALTKGKSRIYGALQSDDTDVMLNALRKLQTLPTGRQVSPSDRVVRAGKSQKGIAVQGNGGKFKSGNVTVDAGASGTTTRFLTALSILREGKTIIKGTKRMKERPIKDLEDALSQISKFLPLSGTKQISKSKSQTPNKNIHTIKIKGDKSSQFLSALLMISPALTEPIRIEVLGKLVSKPYIDTTIVVMKEFGVKVKNNNYKSFVIKPQAYKPGKYTVEGDASAASYWTSIAYLHGGKVRFTNLSKKSVQGDVKYAEILPKLGKTIDMNMMPDVAMTLAVTAPFAKGQTKITGLSTLRIKETDRLAALETELKKAGVEVKTTKDSITIQGHRTQNTGNSRKQLSSESCVLNPIKTYDDHRMAMCFAVLGTKVPGIIIEDPSCVEKTYPNFWEDLELAYLNPIELKQKNLVLTGMRASGKSYLGKKIAKLLKRKFVDLDSEIERSKKMKIKDIVKRYGWPYFRKLEQKMCSAFAKASSDTSFEPLVIATGGGVVLDSKNMKALKKNGVNVFIFTDPSVIAERIKEQSGNRPTLTGEGSVKEIQKVWKDRRDLYLKYADVVWDNTSGEVLNKNLSQIFI